MFPDRVKPINPPQRNPPWYLAPFESSSTLEVMRFFWMTSDISKTVAISQARNRDDFVTIGEMTAAQPSTIII